MLLTQQQVAQYFDDGFLIVEDLLDETDLRPVVDEFNAMVDEYATRLHDDGKITDTHADKGFADRLAAISQASGRTPAF